MSIEDAFTGAKIAYTQLYAYVNAVSEEIGMERALAILTKTNEEMGTEAGKRIKEQSGTEIYDVKKTALKIMKVAKGIGSIDEIVEESPEKVVTMTASGKCTNYEAAKAAGLDDQKIEAICGAGSLHFLNALVKQLNPDLSYQLGKFRSSPDDCCLENIVLDK